mmetsp:Transcript_5136/g.15066  ORF Transcript_5136/g.15066 Transcript_5136/m.15066 type:complete len:208 (+) Transcript_5136:502-1125(+)
MDGHAGHQRYLRQKGGTVVRHVFSWSRWTGSWPSGLPFRIYTAEQGAACHYLGWSDRICLCRALGCQVVLRYGALLSVSMQRSRWHHGNGDMSDQLSRRKHGRSLLGCRRCVGDRRRQRSHDRALRSPARRFDVRPIPGDGRLSRGAGGAGLLEGPLGPVPAVDRRGRLWRFAERFCGDHERQGWLRESSWGHYLNWRLRWRPFRSS